MKKPTDDLIILIKSLTANEQGNFKKFVKRHSETDNIYLRLFETIQAQEAYNEAELKKMFKDLAVHKQHLYEVILQSMMSFSMTLTSVNSILDRNMFYAKLLGRKGLITQALKVIRKSLKIAESNESHDTIGLLLGLEIDTLMHQATPEKIWYIATTLHPKMELAYQRIMNIDAVLAEQKKLGYILECKAQGKPCVEFIKYVNLAFLEDPANALTERAEHFRQMNLCWYYEISENYERSFEAAKLNLRFNEKLHKKHFPKRGHIYLQSLVDFIRNALRINRLKEAQKALDILISLPHISHVYDLMKETNHVIFNQQIYWKQGKIKDGYVFSKDFLEKFQWVDNVASLPLELFTIQAQHAVLAFLHGELKEAYLTAQKLYELNKEIKKVDGDLHAALLTILIQAELKNFGVLKSITRSVRRKHLLRAKNNMPALGKFLNVMDKYSGVSFAGMNELLKPQNDIVLFNIFSLSDWIRSKVNE